MGWQQYFVLVSNEEELNRISNIIKEHNDPIIGQKQYNFDSNQVQEWREFAGINPPYSEFVKNSQFFQQAKTYYEQKKLDFKKFNVEIIFDPDGLQKTDQEAGEKITFLDVYTFPKVAGSKTPSNKYPLLFVFANQGFRFHTIAFFKKRNFNIDFIENHIKEASLYSYDDFWTKKLTKQYNMQPSCKK
jgi:hypothetical protein